MTNSQTNATTRGREDLLSWDGAHPKNAYTSDTHFRNVLGHYAGEKLNELEEDLVRFGQEVAGPVDELVRENNLHTNLPRLERFSGLGTRQEKIVHHPTYHEAGRYIYGSGIMEAYANHPNSLGALSRFYVSSYLGEAGHNCPLACTAGVIRVLQELGTDELKQRFLQRFLDRDYDLHFEGAQFLTEVQGGSDVGANATRAEQAADGTWRISGEKWFCSNIDADVFLMTARPDDAPEGTRGLGLFLVPRKLEDGTVNNFHVRRLKDKLGTRSMASGETDFNGAVAYHMGEVGDGFRNMMQLVINTSRLYNAVGCAGGARRAYLTAKLYAEHRKAFGTSIINYPLVSEHLADMRAELDTMVSGTFHMVALQDRIDAGEVEKKDLAFQRLGINLNKVRTAKSGRWMNVQAIEILGGNGAIESFSVLPRLLRDSIVYENWEGTHNTLIMQMYRDMKKYRIQQGFFEYLGDLIAAKGVCETKGPELKGVLGELQSQLDQVMELEMGLASLELRPLLDDLCYAMYAAVRLNEMANTDATELDNEILEHFFDVRLRARRGRDADYMARCARIAGA